MEVSMNKSLLIIILSICIVTLGLSVAAITVVCTKPQEKIIVEQVTPETDTQYVLYLGTNDKDTVLPVYTPEVCTEKAKEILIKHFGGYTIQDANGGWLDGETLYTEYTLVIYLSDTTLDKVHAACDEMIEVFNQSSILIQTNQTVTEFYSGTK